MTFEERVNKLLKLSDAEIRDRALNAIDAIMLSTDETVDSQHAATLLAALVTCGVNSPWNSRPVPELPRVHTIVASDGCPSADY